MVDFETVKNDAIGRWPGIYSALGIQVGTGKHCSCPMCGGKDRFRMDNKKEKGTWFCNHCQSGDGWKLLQEVLGCDFKSACEQVAGIIGSVEKSKYQKEKTIDPKVLRKMFDESKPMEKTDLVGQYLSGRGLTLFPGALRYTKKCWEPETKKDQHAMLGIVTLPDGTAATIHRTYLDVKKASKLDIEKQKKLMPGVKKITGGAIRLFKPDNGAIGIAEGIETSIACTQKFMIPTWAAISSTILESFEPPKEIKKVYVFGDNDKNFAGQKSAYTLANRLNLKRKLEVEVIIPELIGDWLDHIKEI